jgi:hypothetical protein
MIWIGVLLVGVIQFFVRQPAVLAIRCPLWRAEFGALIDRKYGVANVRFCPACGMSMDDEVGTGSKKYQSEPMTPIQSQRTRPCALNR